MIQTRNAVLPDVDRIHAIIQPYADEGTLLPRTRAELAENIRDFVVAEENGCLIGCGALHLYGLHLAEIRSIAVAPEAKGVGAGRALVEALMDEAHATASPASAFSRGHPVSSRISGSKLPAAPSCPTKSIRIASAVLGSTTATKSPWSGASSRPIPMASVTRKSRSRLFSSSPSEPAL